MSKRLAVVVLFALVVSGAASFFLYRLLGSRVASQVTQPTTTVLVAAKQLEVGTMIKDGDVNSIQWPGAVQEGVLTKPEEIIGRGVVQTIYSGEPVRASRLAPIGAGAGLAATIPVGMRAVAIRVNDIVGVAGFVTPGQRVDLLIMGLPPNSGANTGTVSKTLLQNIEVLSAGSQIQKDAEGKPIPVPVVNLLVTPEQAEVVSLASNHAQIQLILRNPLDKDDSKTKGAAYTKLFTENPLSGAGMAATPQKPVRRALPPPPPKLVAAEKKAPEPPPVIVEILHGGAKAQVQFKRSSEGQ